MKMKAGVNSGKQTKEILIKGQLQLADSSDWRTAPTGAQLRLAHSLWSKH